MLLVVRKPRFCYFPSKTHRQAQYCVFTPNPIKVHTKSQKFWSTWNPLKPFLRPMIRNRTFFEVLRSKIWCRISNHLVEQFYDRFETKFDRRHTLNVTSRRIMPNHSSSRSLGTFPVQKCVKLWVQGEFPDKRTPSELCTKPSLRHHDSTWTSH